MTAYNNLDSAIAGLKSGLDTRVESWAAAEDINFGRPVFSYLGSSKVYNFKLDVGKIAFDADFVTSNQITITVNGTAADAVTWTVDHDTTMALVVAAVDALAGVECVSDSADNNNRTLLIQTLGTDATVAEAITGGGSQATGTVTYDSSQVCVGVSMLTYKEDGKYVTGDAVNVITEGQVWVDCNTDAAKNAKAYLDIAGADKGKFSDTAGTDIGCIFQSNLASAGIVLISVDGQTQLTHATKF